MDHRWQDCIVTYIDLIGTKKLRQGGHSSMLMRRLHELVVRDKKALQSIDHAYTWNDCVLLLSYVDKHKKTTTFEAAIRDAEALKRTVDREVGKSYAIAVKGQAFPGPPVGHATAQPPGVTVVKASSWAMANCFKIEKELGHLKRPWYIDSRIAAKIRTKQSFEDRTLELYGSRMPRVIRAFSGYLWDAATVSKTICNGG